MPDAAKHAAFMKEALQMVRTCFPFFSSADGSLLLQGEKALHSGETPVGCVLVYNDQIVAWGMNDTNRSLNVRNPRTPLLR